MVNMLDCDSGEEGSIPSSSAKLVYYSDNKRHLICEPYSIENLHKMAQNLGIKRCWFHKNPYPHYDIPKKMLDFVAENSYIVDSKTLLNKIKRGIGNGNH